MHKPVDDSGKYAVQRLSSCGRAGLWKKWIKGKSPAVPVLGKLRAVHKTVRRIHSAACEFRYLQRRMCPLTFCISGGADVQVRFTVRESTGLFTVASDRWWMSSLPSRLSSEMLADLPLPRRGSTVRACSQEGSAFSFAWVPGAGGRPGRGGGLVAP